MRRTIIPREEAARHLSVTARVLARYEARGLVRAAREGPEEGYRPEEVRRLWTIVSLQRDLGINLAGVEAVLKLRAHVDGLHRQLDGMVRRMREALEAPEAPDEDA
jgi:MerR family transcriptional regulator, heat shock protein HspR